jgi:hypothetical protein
MPAATERIVMKKFPLLVAALLVTACGGGGEDKGNQASPSAQGSGGGADPAKPIGASDSLTGLYELKSGGLPSQLCIIQRGGGAARFGLNIWGANMHACSGAGTVERKGSKLTLVMAGDRSCTVDAAIEGNAIRLAGKVPEGCAYYCGKNVAMTGISLARSGNTEADALKARDVVDEPLCDAPAKG